jgi:type IX secretion system PorP/SprF family membrane protein
MLNRGGKLRKTGLIGLIFIAIPFRAGGQDPYFSQFFNNILYLNPAYAGSAYHPRISASYRNQMPALGSPFVSYNASYDQSVEALQGGIGINIMNDVQGPALNRISADAIYSYFLAVNQRLTINAGFQVSYVHRFMRASSLVLPDVIEGTGQETLVDMNKGYPDFAVGFVALTRNAYAGISMHHLTKPNLSFSKSPAGQHLPRKLTVHGGILIPLYERKLGREALKLNPGLLYVHQAGFRQAGYGVDVLYKSVYAGSWFRHSLDFHMNAFVVQIGYDQDYFRIGYSHDFNVSKSWRNMQNAGAHELTFLLKLENKSGQGGRFRTIKSPKI